MEFRCLHYVKRVIKFLYLYINMLGAVASGAIGTGVPAMELAYPSSSRLHALVGLTIHADRQQHN